MLPQARRGFDADAFAQQMQHTADNGDADTLDALAGQLRDVLDEDFRATCHGAAYTATSELA
jgi:hypothetical protein